jgi:hypothetical protein
MKMRRRAALSDVELACVRYLAGRAGITELQPSDDDRSAIEGVLRRLAQGLKLAAIDADLSV